MAWRHGVSAAVGGAAPWWAGQCYGGRGSDVVDGAVLRWAGQCRGHAPSPPPAPEAPAHVALAGREPRALRCGLTSLLWDGPVTPLLCQ